MDIRLTYLCPPHITIPLFETWLFDSGDLKKCILIVNSESKLFTIKKKSFLNISYLNKCTWLGIHKYKQISKNQKVKWKKKKNWTEFVVWFRCHNFEYIIIIYLVFGLDNEDYLGSPDLRLIVLFTFTYLYMECVVLFSKFLPLRYLKVYLLEIINHFTFYLTKMVSCSLKNMKEFDN